MYYHEPFPPLFNQDILAFLQRFITPLLCDYPQYASADEMSRFSGFLTKHNRQRYVAVFYHLLDPQRIPKADELEIWTEENLCNSRAAITSLMSLFSTRLPKEAAPDLWPRITAWIDFFSTFDDLWRTLMPLPSQKDFYFLFMTFCSHICVSNDSNFQLVVSTPGIRLLALRTWYSISDADFARSEDVLHIIHDLIVHGVGVSMQEVIESSQGNLHNFARLLMRQCEPVVPHDCPPSQEAAMGNFWLFRLATDVVAVVDNLADSQTYSEFIPRPLCEALLSLGFVKTVTMVGCAMCQHARQRSLGSVEWQFLTNCVLLLEILFRGRRPDHVLRTALKFGLLRIVLSCALIDPSDPIHSTLSAFIENTLTPATIHHSVLLDLVYAEAQVASAMEIRNSAAREAWKTFGNLVRCRGGILELFNSNERISQKACDNVKCGTISEKRDLKRCSGCLASCYCSSECQVLDWQRGHRQSCAWHRLYRQTIRVVFTPKEHAFMRFLLQHECDENKLTLTTDYLRGRQREPQAVLLTVYDYTSGQLKIERRSREIKNLGGDETENKIYWLDVIDRVLKSAGRMTLDVMRVSAGERKYELILPMRWISQDIPRALEEIIAQGDELGEAEMKTRVEEIMQRESATYCIV
ncbi:hypothetical protein R3P38DRAFT_2588248 [Favolaschia claudopus]|uniref:MYND-type domain-containing protein n=1 Tax=Favolaschia claudopus TaxID=2862362 RepID=A0AAV9Z3J2_9AGAR